MDNENKKAPRPSAPKPTEQNTLKTSGEGAQESGLKAQQNIDSVTESKTTISSRMEDLAEGSAASKKKRTALITGAAALAIALSIFGVNAAITGANTAKYNDAVASHEASIAEISKTDKSTIATQAEYVETLKAQADTYAKQVAAAAATPEDLVKKAENEPVVKLNESLKREADELKAAIVEAEKPADATKPGKKVSKLASPKDAKRTEDAPVINKTTTEQAQKLATESKSSLKDAKAELKSVTDLIDALDTERIDAAALFVKPAEAALKNKNAVVKAATKAEGDTPKTVAAKADALGKALDAYTAADAEKITPALADNLLKTHSEFVTSVVALKASHTAVVDREAAEAAAAQAAAEAEAAANAYVEPQWDGGGYIEPEWNGSGGGWNPPPTNNGGGGWTPPPSNGGGGGGGNTGGWDPSGSGITADPCEATNTCLNNNI
ncbi:MAG: hypothetical protein ACTJGT_03950 [Microbacteriaceae bacterium]